MWKLTITKTDAVPDAAQRLVIARAELESTLTSSSSDASVSSSSSGGSSGSSRSSSTSSGGSPSSTSSGESPSSTSSGESSSSTSSEAFSESSSSVASWGRTAKIFLMERRSTWADGPHDVPIGVCSPADLQFHPEDAPPPDGSVYRVDEIQMVFRNEALADEIIDAIRADVETLKELIGA